MKRSPQINKAYFHPANELSTVYLWIRHECRDLETVPCHRDCEGLWKCPIPVMSCMGESTCHSNCQVIHSLKVPKDRGSATGRPEKGHDSRWRSGGQDRGVFNCLVVNSEILLGDIVARVMTKINTQDPIYSGIVKCSTYLLNIH